MRRAPPTSLALLAASAVASFACGARSGLDVPVAADAAIPLDAQPPPPLRSHCAVGPSGSASPIAAVNAGGVVSFVDERGSVSTPYTFPAPGAGTTRLNALIASRGSYVAAAVFDVPDTQPPTTAATLAVALLDLTGRVLTSGAFTTPYGSFGPEANLVGNASGLFVVSVAAGDYTLGVTFSPGQSTSFTDPYIAVAGPDDRGVLLVAKQSNAADDYFWYDTHARTFAPSLYVGSGPTTAAVVQDSSLVYATLSPPTVWIESASGRSALWMAPWGANDVPTVTAASDGPWAAACWSSATSTVAARVSLTGAGASGPVTLSPPPGTSFASSQISVCPRVDTQGSAFQLFVGDSVQAYQAPDLASWKPLGASMGGIASFSAVESGGTYLIAGSSIGGPPVVSGGPGAQLGNQLQVVRPASQASVTLPAGDWANQTYPAYLMTRDGGCVAYFEQGALTVADARMGAVQPTALTVDPSNMNLALAWTNVPGDGQVWTALGY